MRSVWTLIPLIRHQRGQVLLVGVLHALSAVLSLFTFLSVVPFLRILFGAAPSADSQEGVLAWISLGFDGFVQREGASVALAVLCGAMVVLALLKNAVQYAALYVMAGIRTGVSRDLRQDLYGKLMSMPMAWFSESKRGDVMSRFTHDLMEVEHSVIGSLEALLKSPLMVLVSLATLVALSWELTLFAFVLLPVTGALISRWSKRLKRHAQKGKEELGQLVTVLEETLLGMRIVKAFNAESQFTASFSERNHGHFKAMRRMHRRESMSSPMSEVISLSVMALLLAYGGSLVLAGDSTLSGDWFIGYLVVFSQIIPPARSLADGYFRVSKGVASLDRLNELFEVSWSREADLGEAGAEAPTCQRALVFEDVVYRYPEQDAPALNGLNLTIPAGQVVALVGLSGSGKTTAAHMLSKFANPDKGTLWVDDTDLRTVSGHAWRAKLAVVTQDALLFPRLHRRQHCAGRRHPRLGSNAPCGGSGARVGVCGSVARRVGRQSGGQRRQAQRRPASACGVGKGVVPRRRRAAVGRGHIRLGRKLRVVGSASAGTSCERENRGGHRPPHVDHPGSRHHCGA